MAVRTRDAYVGTSEHPKKGILGNLAVRDSENLASFLRTRRHLGASQDVHALDVAHHAQYKSKDLFGDTVWAKILGQ